MKEHQMQYNVLNGIKQEKYSSSRKVFTLIFRYMLNWFFMQDFDKFSKKWEILHLKVTNNLFPLAS